MSDYAELLSPARNFAVVQLPGRKFPGVVFQGDDLNILLRELRELQEMTVKYGDSEIDARLEDLTERLNEVLQHYEKSRRRRNRTRKIAKIAKARNKISRRDAEHAEKKKAFMEL